MAKLGNILGATHKIPVEYFGEKYEVTYKVGFITPADEIRLKELSEEEAVEFFADLLSKAIVEWNIDDAEPTKETFTQIAESGGMPFLNVLFLTMVEEAQPKKLAMMKQAS